MTTIWRHKFKILSVLYAGFILIMTSIPGKSLPPTFPGFDKIAHFGIYFIFGALIHLAFSENNGVHPVRIAIYTLLIVIGFAIFDEWHQQFIPGRSMEPMDFLADLAGAFLSQLFIIPLKHYFLRFFSE